MRYNQNYQCKGCGAEATAELLDLVLDFECQACGGRVWVKTVKHRAPVTVDDERFMAVRDIGHKAEWFDPK
jgi:DNA-directed RNA polymerase subunit RPC12/RpoP